MATVQGTPTYNTGGSGATTATHSITVVGTGCAIIVTVHQEDTLTRTFSVSSSVNGSFGSAVSYINPTGAVGLWVLRSVSPGAHTITLTASTSGVGFGSFCLVMEDLGTETPITDFINAGANGGSHVSGATGITTTGDAFVVCVGALTGNVTTKIEGSGYTLVNGPFAANPRFAQYQNFTTPLTNHTGAWTSTGTNRVNRGVIVGFPTSPPLPPSAPAFLSHFME